MSLNNECFLFRIFNRNAWPTSNEHWLSSSRTKTKWIHHSSCEILKGHLRPSSLFPPPPLNSGHLCTHAMATTYEPGLFWAQNGCPPTVRIRGQRDQRAMTTLRFNLFDQNKNTPSAPRYVEKHKHDVTPRITVSSEFKPVRIRKMNIITQFVSTSHKLLGP